MVGISYSPRRTFSGLEGEDGRRALTRIRAA
jgi:hypothetical protein